MAVKSSFSLIEHNPLFLSLPLSEQEFIKTKGMEYGISFQDFLFLINSSIELELWQEGVLSDYWIDAEPMKNYKQRKTRVLNHLKNCVAELRSREKDYSKFTAPAPEIMHNHFELIQDERQILGDCPVASAKTRCCNLKTLDAVINCGFDCSYCSIQSFYHNNTVFMHANLKEKLSKLELDPAVKYHIGTGQSSDSLMWGNKNGLLDVLAAFARNNPNVVLELKTKSANIEWFEKNDVPANMIVTWSLNTETIVRNEERGTAPLASRLKAARKLADKGILVGFHFHPMVYYKGWEAEYASLFAQVKKQFQASELITLSFGTITFIKPAIKMLKSRRLSSKITQMPLAPASGKLSYPTAIKQRLFGLAGDAFKEWRGMVYMYLCMEDPELWNDFAGFEYEDNDAFEKHMIESYFIKINAK